MLCIQDPSYENSKYLHETLLSECVDCTVGAGAYAFATKDGINLLLSDENFKKFLERGTYTLVVGTDDIDIVSPGEFTHSKLNSSEKNFEANHEAELLIVCR